MKTTEKKRTYELKLLTSSPTCVFWRLSKAAHLFFNRFSKKLFKWYTGYGIYIKCVQTDNDFEFTSRIFTIQRNLPTLFGSNVVKLDICYAIKLIHTYTSHHNGKVEHIYREEQMRFLLPSLIFSLDTFVG